MLVHHFLFDYAVLFQHAVLILVSFQGSLLFLLCFHSETFLCRGPVIGGGGGGVDSSTI